jgi:Ser/Thr protein kinase RdoA (MazF antagonist)
MAKKFETFSLRELGMVLSYYDIGTIDDLQPFEKGSPTAPKLLVSAGGREYLLKRRQKGMDYPPSVAFSHGLQIHLAHRQFPLPHLIGTRKDDNSMVQIDGNVYEMFEFLHGDRFDYTSESTQDAGRVFALFNKLLRDYKSEFEPPVGGYHDHPALYLGFERLEMFLQDTSVTPEEDRAEARERMERIKAKYTQAKNTVDALGLKKWKMELAHADWHPGNMMFVRQRVVAVIDFDGARVQQRIVDVANGALQFCVLLQKGDPREWPDHLHAGRLKSFLQGYESVEQLTTAEVEAAPWLMMESLICEIIFSIRKTGTMHGFGAHLWLMMLEKKINWIENHRDGLLRLIGN